MCLYSIGFTDTDKETDIRKLWRLITPLRDFTILAYCRGHGIAEEKPLTS